jgi:hypothetical protein
MRAAADVGQRRNAAPRHKPAAMNRTGSWAGLPEPFNRGQKGNAAMLSPDRRAMMFGTLGSASLLWLPAGVCGASPPMPIAETRSGKVRGLHQAGVDVYRGILTQAAYLVPGVSEPRSLWHSGQVFATRSSLPPRRSSYPVEFTESTNRRHPKITCR